MKKYFDDVFKVLSAVDEKEVEFFYEVLVKANEYGKHVYLLGDGDSSSVVLSFMADFVKNISSRIPVRYQVSCLNDNPAVLLSIASNVGYSQLFKYMMEDVVKKDDVVIIFSNNGNAKVVVDAAIYAKEQDALLVSLIGDGGGKIAPISDVSIVIEDSKPRVIADVQTIVYHYVLTKLEDKLVKWKFL